MPSLAGGINKGSRLKARLKAQGSRHKIHVRAVKGMTAGDYLEKTGGGSPVNQDDYNTAYGYDERGNITTLSRKGMYGDPGDLKKSNIDSLTYTYFTETNQLKNIAEDQSGEAGEEGYYKANGNDYEYDDNDE